MATAAKSTKETTNYARLCRLLVDVGTLALRDKFNGIHSPANLQAVLAANKPMLQSLRARKVINPTQWGKLFPVILSSVSSVSFDITLLMVLLRNICGLAAPASGWDALPLSTDINLEADITRVKYYRNTVYAHAERAFVDDATFNGYWSEIRDTLVRLGGVAYKTAVDNLETECMDPAMEEHYRELLRQWKNDEDNIKDELKEIGADIKILTKKIDDLVESTVSSKKETCAEGKVFNSEMSAIDTSLVCREKHHESKLLKSFCEQCKVCICDTCGQTRHSHHIKVDIEQAAQECKVNIEEIAQEMKKEVADFQLQVERSKERTRKSREEIAEARNKALTSLEELMRVLKEHETTTMTNLDLLEEKELRGQATQLDHFQTSINQLQKSVEYCEAILRRNKNSEILQVHQALVEPCRGLLNAEKLNINRLLHTALHARYEINDELVEALVHALPGRLVVSKTDHLQSAAEGKGLQEAGVGKEADFIITTKDSNEERCYDEDDRIIVKIETPSGVELDHKITNREDGEYSVTYTPDCVGQHDVGIEVNGQPLPGNPWPVHVSHSYRYLFSFGSQGKSRGQFDYPLNIAIDDRIGNIAVADYNNNTVQLFSSEGKHLNTVSGKEIIKPSSVAFTRSGDLIVIASNKIFCFIERGKLVKSIIDKHLKKPDDLTIARDGRMVVCDVGDNAVKVLSPDGARLLNTISDPDNTRPWSAVCHQDIFVVCYYRANNVKVFSKDGVFLHSIGTHGSAEEQLLGPLGLSIDSFSNLVVCDSGNSRLQIYTLDGKLVSKIEGQHSGPLNPVSVAVSPATRHLYVTDTERYCVYVYH